MVMRCAWGTCNNDERYPERLQGARFITFPKPKTQLEKCLKWIKACGRAHTRLNVDNINKHKAVCSKHFVGGDGPTVQYPDPIQAEGAPCKPVRALPRERPPLHPDTLLASPPPAKEVQPLQDNTDSGESPASSFLRWRQEELSDLKTMEDSLDEVIRTCAQQLFDLTDDPDNVRFAYITYEDIGRIKVFWDQTVMAVKSPEDTTLEVPAPREDSIQMNLKALKGPIVVVTLEMGFCAATGGCFVALERSRVRIAALNTESTNPQSAVKSS